MKKRIINNIMYLLFGLILLNGFMYVAQPSMTFFPHATLGQTPTQWGLAYEDVYLDTEDGVRLHGWYIPHQQAKQTLLFFHGNAGNISHRGRSVEIFHRLGLNVFIISYRGFGQSEGSPDEFGLYYDAMAAWQYLINDRATQPQDIIVFGRSLGGVVATQLAAQVQPGGLIVESTFSSAADVADVMFPILSHLIALRYEFDTVSNIKQVNSPVLVLHSPDDEIIPIELGKKVFQAANEPKTFVKMRGGHNNGIIMSQPEYERSLAAFISTINSVQ